MLKLLRWGGETSTRNWDTDLLARWEPSFHLMMYASFSHVDEASLGGTTWFSIVGDTETMLQNLFAVISAAAYRTKKYTSQLNYNVNVCFLTS
mmetsp:Transcript_10211/g.21906  ORF Transcript_10211/g.21906 Transcript_10211/m.21906 type:complete len:93 (-) Transcript_10211:172-450(-)